MWEVIKDFIKFIAQLLAKRKATFEAVVRCKYTMNSKGKTLLHSFHLDCR